jgi:hypothetical protein
MKKEKIDYFEYFMTVTELAVKQAELLVRIADDYECDQIDDGEIG